MLEGESEGGKEGERERKREGERRGRASIEETQYKIEIHINFNIMI